MLTNDWIFIILQVRMVIWKFRLKVTAVACLMGYLCIQIGLYAEAGQSTAYPDQLPAASTALLPAFPEPVLPVRIDQSWLKKEHKTLQQLVTNYKFFQALDKIAALTARVNDFKSNSYYSQDQEYLDTLLESLQQLKESVNLHFYAWERTAVFKCIADAKSDYNALSDEKKKDYRWYTVLDQIYRMNFKNQLLTDTAVAAAYAGVFKVELAGDWKESQEITLSITITDKKDPGKMYNVMLLDKADRTLTYQDIGAAGFTFHFTGSRELVINVGDIQKQVTLKPGEKADLLFTFPTVNEEIGNLTRNFFNKPQWNEAASSHTAYFIENGLIKLKFFTADLPFLTPVVSMRSELNFFPAITGDFSVEGGIDLGLEDQDVLNPAAIVPGIIAAALTGGGVLSALYFTGNREISIPVGLFALTSILAHSFMLQDEFKNYATAYLWGNVICIGGGALIGGLLGGVAGGISGGEAIAPIVEGGGLGLITGSIMGLGLMDSFLGGGSGLITYSYTQGETLDTLTLPAKNCIAIKMVNLGILLAKLPFTFAVTQRFENRNGFTLDSEQYLPVNFKSGWCYYPEYSFNFRGLEPLIIQLGISGFKGWFSNRNISWNLGLSFIKKWYNITYAFESNNARLQNGDIPFALFQTAIGSAQLTNAYQTSIHYLKAAITPVEGISLWTGVSIGAFDYKFYDVTDNRVANMVNTINSTNWKFFLGGDLRLIPLFAQKAFKG